MLGDAIGGAIGSGFVLGILTLFTKDFWRKALSALIDIRAALKTHQGIHSFDSKATWLIESYECLAASHSLVLGAAKRIRQDPKGDIPLDRIDEQMKATEKQFRQGDLFASPEIVRKVTAIMKQGQDIGETSKGPGEVVIALEAWAGSVKALARLVAAEYRTMTGEEPLPEGMMLLGM